MDSIDQKLVDFLYENIFVQKLRSNHFLSMAPPNSVWNKHADEKKILDNTIDAYKGYYVKKAEEMKARLETEKNRNVNSYLTYDTEFYVNQFNERVEEITKYLVELESRDLEYISKNSLNSVSDTLDVVFPHFMTNPS